MPPSTRAWPPIGVRQEPSSTARKARSAASAVAVSAIVDRGDQRARRGVVGAGFDPDGALADRRQESSGSRMAVAADNEPEPLQSGDRQQRRVDLAGLELAQPRFDIAAQRHDREVRPQALRPSACRRSDAVPTTAPGGRSRKVLALRLMKASRASSRGRKPASTRPAGSTVGMSFEECTARSIAPASSASSISLVNRPLPPASASGRSWISVAGGADDLDLDPLRVEARRRGEAALAPRAPATSASGEPREPMRRRAVGVEDCVMGPSSARPPSLQAEREAIWIYEKSGFYRQPRLAAFKAGNDARPIIHP